MEKKIIEKALGYYGERHQIDKVIEESAELIQAISKMREYQEVSCGDYTNELRSNLITELADVYITLEYVKIAYEIDENELNNEIKFKINRLKERLEDERLFE